MIGSTRDFDRATRVASPGPLTDIQWMYVIVDDTNGSWDPGETLFITARSSKIPSHVTGEVYFQFILTTGLTRSIEFTASD